jgi:hypothetical protein
VTARRDGESGSLFGAPLEPRPEPLEPRPDAPLADRLRPRTLDEILGQDEVLGPGTPLRRAIEADALRSLILWGRPARARRRSRTCCAGSPRRISRRSRPCSPA